MYRERPAPTLPGISLAQMSQSQTGKGGDTRPITGPLRLKSHISAWKPCGDFLVGQPPTASWDATIRALGAHELRQLCLAPTAVLLGNREQGLGSRRFGPPGQPPVTQPSQELQVTQRYQTPNANRPSNQALYFRNQRLLKMRTLLSNQNPPLIVKN